MWTVLIDGEPYATADSQAEGLDFAARPGRRTRLGKLSWPAVAPQGPRCWCAGGRRRAGPQRQAQGEQAALADGALHQDVAAVLAQGLAADGPEGRPSGSASAAQPSHWQGAAPPSGACAFR
jgi:hypothetical protein